MTALTMFETGQCPELDRQLAATLTAANGGGAPWACRHVVLDGLLPFLCAQHPALGLLCLSCSQRHARRHDQVEEHTCDACRQQVDRICAAVLSAHTPLVRLRDPKGWRRLYSGPIAVLGVGVCETCRDRILAREAA